MKVVIIATSAALATAIHSSLTSTTAVIEEDVRGDNIYEAIIAIKEECTNYDYDIWYQEIPKPKDQPHKLGTILNGFPQGPGKKWVRQPKARPVREDLR
jgi:hypothetical protein